MTTADKVLSRREDNDSKLLVVNEPIIDSEFIRKAVARIGCFRDLLASIRHPRFFNRIGASCGLDVIVSVSKGWKFGSANGSGRTS